VFVAVMAVAACQPGTVQQQSNNDPASNSVGSDAVNDGAASDLGCVGPNCASSDASTDPGLPDVGRDALTTPDAMSDMPSARDMTGDTADMPVSNTTCGDGVCQADEHCQFCAQDCGACQPDGPTIVRGPYLQLATETSIVIKWRTDVDTDSVVAWGPTPGNLRAAVSDAAPTTRHELKIEGLSPETRYTYAVGMTGATLIGDDDGHYFDTLPPNGATRVTRIWAIGDSGDTGSDQIAVRDAYLNYAGAAEANVWLMLGDNAYSDGMDDEYQAAVFDPDAYADLVKRSVIWPTIGNHERVDDNGLASPYFEIFTLPTQGEAGGLASGTEYYYSFDYGDIHFVCLDSDTSSESAAAMTWLRNDLAANDKSWLIAYWHHPPYTNGSHNSDDEGTLEDMRVNFVPILEEYGVDMVFTGHSHSYERSLLLYGHYGASDELAGNPEFVVARENDDTPSDGDPNGDGPYTKVPAASCPDIGTALASTHCGTVYSVVGSSSKISGSDFPTRYDGGPLMPMMFTYKETLGSVVIDIDGNRADVVFLDSGTNGDPNAAITDRWAILK